MLNTSGGGSEHAVVKSLADSITDIFCPQNCLSGVQNSSPLVCTVVCARQLCVAIHHFQQKRTICKLPYKKKNLVQVNNSYVAPQFTMIQCN